MAELTHSIDLDVPVATAYEAWSRFESFPMFMGGVREVRRTGAGRTHWVTDVGGLRREFDAEVTAQRPGELLAWTTVGGDTRHSGVVSFEPCGDLGTRLTVRIVWDPEGLVEKAGGALGLDSLRVKSDLVRFKEFVEDNRVRTRRRTGSDEPGAEAAKAAKARAASPATPPGLPPAPSPAAPMARGTAEGM